MGWDLCARVPADTWKRLIWSSVGGTMLRMLKRWRILPRMREQMTSRLEAWRSTFSSLYEVCFCDVLLDRLKVYWIASSQRGRQHFGCETNSNPQRSTVLKYRINRLHHPRRVHNHGSGWGCRKLLTNSPHGLKDVTDDLSGWRSKFKKESWYENLSLTVVDN